MNDMIFHKEKWEPIKGLLKNKLKEDTSRIPSVKLGSDILVRVIVDESDRTKLIKDAFNETIRMSDCSDVDTIYLCFQRMADLCQVLDYGPAGAWLGIFCEEVLGKYADAQYWYNKAASFGCGLGMYRVGLLYLNKKIPLPSTTNLKRCFTDALANGVPEAKDILDKFFD